jgi:hypothetical protein
MNNKQTLQTNNNTINTNNTELSSILEAINNLPAAGGGGSGGGALTLVGAGIIPGDNVALISINVETGFLENGYTYRVTARTDANETFSEELVLILNEEALGLGMVLYEGYGNNFVIQAAGTTEDGTFNSDPTIYDIYIVPTELPAGVGGTPTYAVMKKQ